jgi:hypothetical protein
MFVRWQSRRRQRSAFGNRDGDVNWKAILVDGGRVDGAPTYRHVAYLGSITESGIEIPAQRRFFWARVLEQLDKLDSRVSAQERQRIIAAVARKVAGPPTQAECEQLDREFEQTMSRLKLAVGGASREPRCCFCGKGASGVQTMVTGSRPGAAICDECIGFAQRALAGGGSTA